MSEQCMFGMDYAFSSWRNDKLPHSDEFKDKINSLFANTISDCYKIAEKIIEKNKELIKKLIPKLVEKRYMDNVVCEHLLKELGGIII